MEGTMEDLLIKLGAAADARRNAHAELMCLDSDHPASGGSPMLTEKLLGDAATAFTNLAEALIGEAQDLTRQRERVLREHPEVFA